MGHGFPPSDADVDDCIVMALDDLADHALVDLEYLYTRVAQMVRGDLTQRHFENRVLELRLKTRKLVCEYESVKGRKRPLWRLRRDYDNERPQWKTHSF